MATHIKNNDQIDMKPGDERIGPVIMIVIGVLALIAMLTESEVVGLLILPALGLVFLVWGFMSHRFGLVVPGCILTGIGVPVFLSEQVLNISGEDTGGLVVLGLGLGFAAMTLIAPMMREKRLLWPLIPAAILGIVGVLLIIGGEALKVLETAGRFWPVILLVIGVYLLLKPREHTQP